MTLHCVFGVARYIAGDATVRFWDGEERYIEIFEEFPLSWSDLNTEPLLVIIYVFDRYL